MHSPPSHTDEVPSPLEDFIVPYYPKRALCSQTAGNSQLVFRQQKPSLLFKWSLKLSLRCVLVMLGWTQALGDFPWCTEHVFSILHLSTVCVHAPLLHVIKICLLSPTLSVLACLSMLSFFLFLLGFSLLQCRLFTLQYKVPWDNYCFDLGDMSINTIELKWIFKHCVWFFEDLISYFIRSIIMIIMSLIMLL